MGAGAGGASRTGWTWLFFGFCSLLAVLTGCWSAARIGVATQPLVLNVLAWTIGAALAVGASRVGARWTLFLLATPLILLLLSLFSAGAADVHRWIAVGPVRINTAELALPIAFATCAGLDRASLLRLFLPAAVAVVIALQPDASQAAATAAAGLVMLLTSTRSAIERGFAALVTAAAVLITLLRPDPLDPIAQVEGIVLVAARFSPFVACLGVAGIAGSIAAPLLLVRAHRGPVRDAALVLTAYSAVAGLAAAVGAFPVPLMGIAVSPILGAWLGLGGLMRVRTTAARRRGLTVRATKGCVGSTSGSSPSPARGEALTARGGGVDHDAYSPAFDAPQGVEHL